MKILGGRDSRYGVPIGDDGKDEPEPEPKKPVFRGVIEALKKRKKEEKDNGN